MRRNQTSQPKLNLYWPQQLDCYNIPVFKYDVCMYFLGMSNACNVMLNVTCVNSTIVVHY